MKPWYQMTEGELYKELKTDRNGLSAGEAQKRITQYGYNRLEEKPGKSPFLIFFEQFTNLLILILIIAAVISAFIGDLIDTIVILAIVLLNAVIGFFQEYRAERALSALKKLEIPTATIIRDGKHHQIPSTDIVSGDIAVLTAGEIVPADIRLIESPNLMIDESPLTGESTPVEKSTNIINEETSLADRRNMTFKGTVITYGRGVGVVVTTGMSTELGRIANLLQETEKIKTPLQIKLDAMGKRIAAAALLICLIIFIAGIWRGESLQLMSLTSISLAVAAIPESLPAVITIVLALGAYRMSKVNALIRKLPAVETLGCVTAICSDKTGTLTQNKMKVEFIYDGRELKKEWSLDTSNMNLIFKAITLCNDASIDNDRGIGDPTEIALLKAASEIGIHKHELEKSYPRINEIPFDSFKKRMTTIHSSPDNPKIYLMFMKGSVDSVIEICSIDSNMKGQILKENEKMAADGIRVLAVAYKEIEKGLSMSDVEKDFIFLGLVGMIDPPREEAYEAVKICMKAGIVPVMITGDHPITAQAIAKRLGITNENGQIITGRDMEILETAHFNNLLPTVRVFARVSPEDKIHIVSALKERGHIVAMTGDGVNDAPALKKADIGIAMGITGTDVSKDASDMILRDDNFATIVKAVHEGRVIYDNIRKFIRYMLSTNSGEILTMFFALMIGMPLPVLPIQILWINLVTDSFPALALGVEPAEKDVMNRPPRDPKESIFARGLWQHIIWVGLLMSFGTLGVMEWGLKHDDLEHARSMVFFTLAGFQMFHVMAIRSERESIFTLGLLSNKALLSAEVLTFSLQLMITYIPILQRIFKTAPLSAIELFICITVSFSVFIAVEIEKAYFRRKSSL
ncbi:MAG: calcium-translocating P-type ATPase, PMCA-type [Nitrospinae bacterium]|nr:calcium-translocating P-type ATPase, PMCA-type [Nitrospinota bacterium]